MTGYYFPEGTQFDPRDLMTMTQVRAHSYLLQAATGTWLYEAFSVLPVCRLGQTDYFHRRMIERLRWHLVRASEKVSTEMERHYGAIDWSRHE